MVRSRAPAGRPPSHACESSAACIGRAPSSRQRAGRRAPRRTGCARPCSESWSRRRWSRMRECSISTRARARSAWRPFLAVRRRRPSSSRRGRPSTRSVPTSPPSASRTGSASSRSLPAGAPFDLVFADPPWALVDDGAAIEALAGLLRARAVGMTTWIVLEHSSRSTPPARQGGTPGGQDARDGAGLGELAAFDTRRYGDTALTFYKPDILVPLSL